MARLVELKRNKKSTAACARWCPLAVFAMVLVGAVSSAAGNPAMAEQMRKSTISDQAAKRVGDQSWADRIRGATTVADRLAEINGVGSQPHPAQGGPLHGNGAAGPNTNGFDFQSNDSRMRRGWDPSHYSEKPYNRVHFRGYASSGGFSYGGYYPLSSGYSLGYGYGYLYDPWLNNQRYWSGYPYGVDGRLVNGVQPGSNLRMPAAAPEAADAAPPEPETDIEAARRLISSAGFDEAIDRYRAYLVENRDDFSVMAELAVALAGANRFDDAAAMVRMAYSKDPTLSSRPIDARVEVPSHDLRKVVVRTVRFAHKRESASAWLLVAVLMQAEDRDPVGLRMVERAVDRGLSSDIGDAMSASLR